MDDERIYIGCNFKRDRCCVLYTHHSFEDIQRHSKALAVYDFKYESTDWNGNDEIKRTLKLKRLKLTGREILLPSSLTFSGADYDHGNKYSWSFQVATLLEAEHDGDTPHCHKCDNCQNWIDDGDWFYEAKFQGKVIHLCEYCCYHIQAMKYFRSTT